MASADQAFSLATGRPMAWERARAVDGSPRERRQLKHRAEGDARVVPTHPELDQAAPRTPRQLRPGY